MESLDGLSLFYRQQILDHLLRVEPRLELLLKSYYDEKLEKEKKHLEDTVFLELKESYEYSLGILKDSNGKLTEQLDTISETFEVKAQQIRDSYENKLQLLIKSHEEQIKKMEENFNKKEEKATKRLDSIIQQNKEVLQVQDSLNHEMLGLKKIIRRQAKVIDRYQKLESGETEKDSTIQLQQKRIAYLESLLGVEPNE